jgi:hypothetical protein
MKHFRESFTGVAGIPSFDSPMSQMSTPVKAHLKPKKKKVKPTVSEQFARMLENSHKEDVSNDTLSMWADRFGFRLWSIPALVANLKDFSVFKDRVEVVFSQMPPEGLNAVQQLAGDAEVEAFRFQKDDKSLNGFRIKPKNIRA